MSSKVFALYDVMGIQDFIFSTNKLKENIGSSFIVSDILNKHLINVIRDTCNNRLEILTEDESFLSNDYDAIIIYKAGGNAFVLFKDINKAKEVTQALSNKILIKTGGQLSLAVAYQDVKYGNFQDDYDELGLKIEKNKMECIRTKPLLGIGITKLESSSGLPIQIQKRYDLLENLSYPTYLKRERGEKKDFIEYLGKYSDKYVFPKDIDDLCQKPEESYIALVHIDGNNIGKIRNNIIRAIKDYKEALLAFNEFSIKLDKLFNDTMKLTIENLINSLNDKKIREVLSCKRKDEQHRYLPIRPIIINGDDITFITHGKLGIGICEAFLKNLHQNQLKFELKGKHIEISASGGIFITKSGFPFYRAYDICEQLCKSAKLKAKIIQTNKSLTGENWIDFHISHSGMSMDLSEVREQKYNIIGLDKPGPLELKENGIVIQKYEQFNLLWRPWCITNNSDKKNILYQYSWNNLKQLIEGFKKNKWPKNKLINFKKSLLTSKERINQFLIEIKSRELKPPKYFDSNEVWDNEGKMTPFYDALEVISYYYNILKEDNSV